MQDSIIVYRNPMEKAMWESGNMHLGIIFAITMGITFFLVYKGLEKITGEKWNQPNWFLWVSGTLGVIAGVAACWFIG
jgi:hypothetical protein